MIKKYYALAAVSFLGIPVVVMTGAGLVIVVNPEIALHTANYERNYRLIEQARTLGLWATFLTAAVLWGLTVFFLIRAKGLSLRWLPLAALGPFGLVILTALKGDAPVSDDPYQNFTGRLGPVRRVAYELAFFIAVSAVSFGIVGLKRELMILFESFATGASVASIVAVQNASSGMWAFSEGLQEMFLLVFFYLLRPAAFNAAATYFSYRKE